MTTRKEQAKCRQEKRKAKHLKKQRTKFTQELQTMATCTLYRDVPIEPKPAKVTAGIALPKGYVGKARVKVSGCWSTELKPDGTFGLGRLHLHGCSVTVLGAAPDEKQVDVIDGEGRKLRLARQFLHARHSAWACAARPHRRADYSDNLAKVLVIRRTLNGLVVKGVQLVLH
jgi:hypothetical protein